LILVVDELNRTSAFLEEALTIATFEPGMYEIVRTFSPAVR
jgi:hypothetical protein